MFKSIHISHFRGIRSVDIENLKRVNLFFGKNNCGKSSILEAILLLCGPSNPVLPLRINILRGYQGITEKDFLLDFYNLSNTPIFIHNNHRRLQIKPIKSESKDVSIEQLHTFNNREASAYHGLLLEYTEGDSPKVYSSSITIPSNAEIKKLHTKTDSRFVETIYAEYIPANYMQIQMQDKYAKIVVQKGNQAIVKVLQSIEPRINTIQLVGSEVMVDIGLPQLLPINMLGDGIRKIFSILVTIAYCKDGILLVDEVDNGFHFSAMKTLWQAILMMTCENNVQLFITSHNIDSVKGLIEAYKENPEEQANLTVYKLIKKADDTIASLPYDYKNIQYMIKQEIELR